MVKTLHDILLMTSIGICLCPVIHCVCTLNFCLLDTVCYVPPPRKHSFNFRMNIDIVFAIRPLLAHYPSLSVSALRWKAKCVMAASFHC